MLWPLVAEIQRNSRTAPKIIHIDKLKPYQGSTPRNWISPELSPRPRSTPGTGPMLSTPLQTPRSSPRLPRRQLEDIPDDESPTADSPLGQLDEEVESGIEIPTQDGETIVSNPDVPSPNIASTLTPGCPHRQTRRPSRFQDEAFETQFVPSQRGKRETQPQTDISVV